MAQTFELLARLEADVSSFESGMKQAASSIKNLTETAQTASESINNSFNIDPEPFIKVSDVAQDVFSNVGDTAHSALGGISGAFANMGGGIRSLIGSVGKLASSFGLLAGATLIVGTLTSAIGGAVSRFDTLNQYPKIMEAWGFTTDDAERSVNKLSKGIEGLPTTLDEIVSSTQQLVSAGLGLDEATDLAIAFNNAMTMSGASTADTSRAMTQYNQMLATGKVDMMGWRSLMETMPKALNDVAESLLGAEKNGMDLYEALQSGEVTMDEFHDAMIAADQATGGFAEQALSATEGLATAFQNLRTAVSRNMADILSAIDEALENKGLPKMFEQVNGLKGVIDTLGETVAGAVPGIIDGFEKIGKAGTIALLVLPTLMPLVLSSLGILGVGLTQIGVWVSGLSGTFASAFGFMAAQIGTLTAGLTGTSGILASLGMAGGTAFSIMTQGILTFAGIALSAIGPAAILGTIIAGLGLLNNAFGEQIQGMLQTAITKGPEIVSGFVQGITEALPQLIESGMQIIMMLGEAITTNLPVLFESALAIIGALVEGIAMNAEQLIMTAFQIVASLVEGILLAIPELVLMGMQLIESITQGILDNMPMFIETALDIMVQFIESLQTNIPLIVESGVNILVNLAEGIVQALPLLINIAVELVVALLNALIDNAPTIIDGAVAIMETLAKGLLQNLPFLITAVGVLIPALVDAIIQLLPLLISAGIQLVVAIVSAIIQSLPQIIQAGGKLIESLISGIVSLVGSLVSSVSGVIDQAVNAVINKAKEFWNAGKNIVSNIAEGIKSGVSMVTGAIGNVLSAARNLLPFSPPKDKSSPMVDIHKNGIVEQIAKGITKQKSTLTNALSDTLDYAANQVNGYSFGLDMATVGINKPNIDGELATINRQINGAIDHNMNTAKQPAIINLSLGRRDYDFFIEDVTEAQDRKEAIERRRR